MQRWSLECSGLAICFCLGKPDAVTHLNSLNMQTGELFQAPAPDNFHEKLLVSKTALFGGGTVGDHFLYIVLLCVQCSLGMQMMHAYAYCGIRACCVMSWGDSHAGQLQLHV